jgi:hypothetical protein
MGAQWHTDTARRDNICSSRWQRRARKSMIRQCLLTTLLLLAGCQYIPISGGELTGTEMPVPQDWTNIASEKVIQLETNPAHPYSVKLWVAAMDASLYVHAGDNHTQWIENIEKNPDVRVQIGESIYPLRAAQVHDAEEFRRFSDIYEQKYGTRPRNENIAEVYVFRLGRRE